MPTAMKSRSRGLRLRRLPGCSSGLLVASLLPIACGGAAEAPPEVSVFESRAVDGVYDTVSLFVVDDREDAAADELRRRYADEFVEAFAGAAAASSCDPAGWNRRHNFVVVAYPSSDGDARFVGPSERPELAINTGLVTEEGLAAWGEAVHRALTEPPPPVAPAPALLATLFDTATLLAGTRSPESAAEEALVQSVASTVWLTWGLLAATEDASAGEPGDYVLPTWEPLGRFSDVGPSDVILPATGSEDCGIDCPVTPRFEAWRQQLETNLTRSWRPGDEGSLIMRLSGGACSHRCLDLPPKLRNGPFSCRLFVTPREPGCPESLGWAAPDPPVAGEEPVCEVRLLEGAALESCETDIYCADCEPGYCFTRVADWAGHCTEQGLPAWPRVVARVGPNEPEEFRLVCEADP